MSEPFAFHVTEDIPAGTAFLVSTWIASDGEKHLSVVRADNLDKGLTFEQATRPLETIPHPKPRVLVELERADRESGE